MKIIPDTGRAHYMWYRIYGFIWFILCFQDNIFSRDRIVV